MLEGPVEKCEFVVKGDDSPQARRREARSVRNSGQAMVEFAMLLTIFMLLCVGMIHIHNLLTFDYWAQQEARYVSFEQTWASRLSYADPDHEPINDLADGDRFQRPDRVNNLDSDKEIRTEESLAELLAFVPRTLRRIFGHQTEASPPAQVMLAKAEPKQEHYIWHRTSRQWWQGVRERISYVGTALASQDLRKKAAISTDPSFELDDDERGEFPADVSPRPGLERSFSRLLQAVRFGQGFCAEMERQFANKDLPQLRAQFSGRDCPGRYDAKFGVYLANNVDFRSAFEDYGHALESGFDAGEALEVTLDRVLANQFYSFFNTAVRGAELAAVPWLTLERAVRSASLAAADIGRMTSQNRYLGSAAALLQISATQAAELLAFDTTNEDAVQEKLLADTVSSVLQAEQPDELFYLGLSGVIPVTMGDAIGGLEEGVMSNVLQGGGQSFWSTTPNADESDLLEPLIETSAKEVVVSYDSSHGFFPAARRRFTTTPVLASRFYLVTQPWHIPRRENDGTGDFRAPGLQTDTIGEETDEGVLRRRVAGLWLFPSAPSALLDGLANASGIAELSPFVAQVQGFDTFVADLKSFLFVDNPVDQVLDTLNQIPFIGGLVPTFPEWPAVRPAAYPRSVEMRNETNIPDDHMTDEGGAGPARNFSDYVSEQQNYNPPP